MTVRKSNAAMPLLFTFFFFFRPLPPVDFMKNLLMMMRGRTVACVRAATLSIALAAAE